MSRNGLYLTLICMAMLAAGCDLTRNTNEPATNTGNSDLSAAEKQRELEEQRATKLLNETPVELGNLYTAPLQGFALRPPTQTERSSDTEEPGIVAWTRIVPTGVAFRLSINNRQFELKDKTKKIDPIGAIAGLLAVEGLEIESNRTDKLDNRNVIFITARSKTKKIFQTQAWVNLSQLGETAYLLLKVSCNEKYAPLAQNVMNATFPTLKILDVNYIMTMYNANMSRGIKRLYDSTLPERNDLMNSLPTGQIWFLLYADGKPVGFMAKSFTAAKHLGNDGFVAATAAWYNLPSDKPRSMVQDIFCAANRSCERWAEKNQIGEGKDAMFATEEGFRFGEKITCEAILCTKTSRRSFVIPKVERSADDKTTSNATSMADAYLPKGIEFLVPMILDRNLPQAVSFANYQAETNNMDIATYTPGKVEKTTVDGSQVEAQRISYQPRSDADWTTLWVDQSGNILKMNFGGMTAERVSKDRVFQLFPTAQKKIDDAVRPPGQTEDTAPAPAAPTTTTPPTSPRPSATTPPGTARPRTPQPVTPVRPTR